MNRDINSFISDYVKFTSKSVAKCVIFSGFLDFKIAKIILSICNIEFRGLLAEINRKLL